MTKRFEYHSGKFGVVDAHHRTIWLALDDETEAHQIRRTFVSKLTFIIVDLSVFSNFSPTVVMSDYSMEWKVPHTHDLEYITPNLINPEFQRTITHYSDKAELVNESTSSFLSESEAIHDLRSQVFLYLKLLRIPSMTKVALAHIEHAFLVELSVETIEQDIEHYARSLFGQDTLLAVSILKVLGKTVYE